MYDYQTEYYGYGTGGYGVLNLTATSPPQSFTEPLTLSDVKTFMKLPVRNPPDPLEDAELLRLISGARRQAEIMQGRDLVRRQLDLAFDYWPSWKIDLACPLIKVDLVQYTDASNVVNTLVEGTNFVVDPGGFTQPGGIVPAYNTQWPSYTPYPVGSLLIRYTSGLMPDDAWWQSEGMMVRNGMCMLVNEWFMKKLPFLIGTAVFEYPMGLSDSLRQGAVRHVG